VPFVVIGGMFLIFCFLSFNVGSLLSVAETVDTVGQSTMIIGLVAVNTLMAICGGSISATLLKKFFTGRLIN
jgi:ammonia channel protein AmtB